MKFKTPYSQYSDIMEKQTTTNNKPLLTNEEGAAQHQQFPLRDKELPPIMREIVGNAPPNRRTPSNFLPTIRMFLRT